MAEERRSVSLERLQQILPAAYHRYRELVPALELMIQYRIETLSQLNHVADQLEKRRRGGNVVKVVSSAVGIAGTATAAAGAALTPVTLGFGLAILAGGATLATLGSVAAAGAHVTEKVCERVDLEKVQEAIDRDKAQCEAVQQLWKEFESYCVDAINTIALADPKKESDIASVQTWAQVALETVTYPVVLIAEAFQDLLCTSSASSSPGKEDDMVACVAGEALVAILGAVAKEFISNPGRAFRSVVSRLKANFGVALGTVAFVLITTVFLINVVAIFLSLVELKKGSPSKVAKELREKSSQLQKELDGWLDAFGKPGN